jgi:small-conductance mechanosensitive channel
MGKVMAFLSRTLYGNTLRTWAIVLASALIGFLVLRVLIKVLAAKVRKLARRTATAADDALADALEGVKSFFLLCLALYLGSNFLTLPARTRAVVVKVMILVLLWQGAVWASRIFDFWRGRSEAKAGEAGQKGRLPGLAALSILFRVGLWSLILLVSLENLGVNVTALVAGLGVGGVAVALALQNVLGDLFAHVSILLDKPFLIGDFIVVDAQMGTIEHVGLKTTRIRSLGGEQIVFSNTDLLKSRIHNYGRMAERRIVFSVGVTYGTPADKLRAIPGLIRQAVEAQSGVRFDRSNFKDFGDSSLNFETVYYVLDPDYNRFMNTQEAINLGIYSRFEKAGIGFAFPTRTVVIEGWPGKTGPASSPGEQG